MPAHAPAGEDTAEPGRDLGERQRFARAGVETRLLRRLERGQLPVEEELDLHGMRVDAARHAVARFLDECDRRRLGCVRIVTGKGLGSRNAAPVLKGEVDRWLRRRPDVLAFGSAPARGGGTGALLVLLRHGRHAGHREPGTR